MKTGQKGINLIKQFEGCRLEAYKCPAGVWTIGYGHTGGVYQGQKITQVQADAYLRADLEKYEKKVAQYSQYVWRQNEFDALVSFAFNIGSIDQLTANGTRDRTTISEKILLYNKAAGKVLNGLMRRREAERQLFLGYQDNTGITDSAVDKNTEAATAPKPTAKYPYRVRVKISDLYIRKGAGTNYQKDGFTGKGTFIIVEEADGQISSDGKTGKWGLLKSRQKKRNGWICLSLGASVTEEI